MAQWVVSIAGWRRMHRKTFRQTALLCIILMVLIAVSGCANPDSPPQTTGDSSPKTLADHAAKGITDMVQNLEDRGVTVEQLSESSPAAGYLASLVVKYRGFICVPDADGPDGFAYMYDNAAAVVALSDAGADWYAQKIADAMVYAMNHDRVFSDGRLRNAYMGGDPRGDTVWSKISKAEAVKVAGSWVNDNWQEDYYAVSTSAGNMAWAIIAFCRAYQNAPKGKADEYLAAAEKAAGFALSLRSDGGGFTGGYEGWDDNQIKVSYKSTEHNIDLITAFYTLAGIVRGSDPQKADEYTEAGDYAKAFVLSMYNSRGHFFYTGTQDDGKTVSRAVLPLDANTWAILALGDGFKDAGPVMTFVEDNMAFDEGFDFSAGDLDGVWNEGTAQMAVCYHMLGNTEAYDRVMAYLAGQEAPDGSIVAADRDGVSTGFYVAGTDVLWEYNRKINLGATNWLAFAQLKVNPLKCPTEQ